MIVVAAALITGMLGLLGSRRPGALLPVGSLRSSSGLTAVLSRITGMSDDHDGQSRPGSLGPTSLSGEHCRLNVGLQFRG